MLGETADQREQKCKENANKCPTQAYHEEWHWNTRKKHSLKKLELILLLLYGQWIKENFGGHFKNCFRNTNTTRRILTSTWYRNNILQENKTKCTNKNQQAYFLLSILILGSFKTHYLSLNNYFSSTVMEYVKVTVNALIHRII